MNVGPRAVVTRAAARVLLFGLCVLPLACRSNATVFPVRGEVFFQGKPADGAVVHLHPRDSTKCPPAFATVQKDGSFALSTYGQGDGAAAGDYVVTLNWRDEKVVDGDSIFGPDRFRGRYSRHDKSDLKATVTTGENVLPRFDLK
jgi:hypothetical protein